MKQHSINIRYITRKLVQLAAKVIKITKFDYRLHLHKDNKHSAFICNVMNMSRNMKPSPIKRMQHGTIDSPPKRLKASNPKEKEKESEQNFFLACKLVSSKKYFDYRERFLLLYLPTCVIGGCGHNKTNGNIVQMQNFAQSSFQNEITNNAWYDALEVCKMCITPTQYLSANILQEIVEIMLNVHDDEFSEYPAQYIIDICQEILLQNFSMHPPCINNNLRNCYIEFLTSSMPAKSNTLTDRNLYEYNKGIVKYCMNRLEYELSANSKDGPLVTMYSPEELKNQVQEVHWVKKKFEIYETLDRQHRIGRLFAVLETISELLQFDLAIDLSRSSTTQGLGLRSNRLMKKVLDLEPGSNKTARNCQQIFRIFTHVIHLQYPDSMIKIITTWLNTTMQTIYTQESNSNKNYPHLPNTYAAIGQTIYEFIVDMPHESIIRILQTTQPTYMRHVVGMFYLNKILSADCGCIFKTLENFLIQSKWESFVPDNTTLKCPKKPQKIDNKILYLFNVFATPFEKPADIPYAKLKQDWKVKNVNVSLNHVVHTLFLTLDAYLDATNLESVIDTWNNLNRKLCTEDIVTDSSYEITNELKNKYQNDINDLAQISHLLNDLKRKRKLPKEFQVFKNIDMLKF